MNQIDSKKVIAEAMKIRAADKVVFSEAAIRAFRKQRPQFAETPGLRGAVFGEIAASYCKTHNLSAIGVDPQSVVLNLFAEAIAKEERIDFGQALRIATQEYADVPGLTPAETAEMFGPSTKDLTTPEAKARIEKIRQLYAVSPELATRLYQLGTRVEEN